MLNEDPFGRFKALLCQGLTRDPKLYRTNVDARIIYWHASYRCLRAARHGSLPGPIG